MTQKQQPEQGIEEKKSIRELADKEAIKSCEEVEEMEVVTGKDLLFCDLSEWTKGYKCVGFQGTNMYLAIEELNRMKEKKAKIFFGFTSNLVSSGIREVICYMVKNKYVDVVVTTAGGIEEDIIKTLRPSRLGSFNLNGALLREKGLNRVGNVLIPNENYFEFENWMNSFLSSVVDGIEEGVNNNNERESGYRKIEELAIITPSRMVYEMGRKVQNEESFCYWAYKNNIPVYCPGITDGSIGDMITCYERRRNIVIDVAEDIVQMNREGLFCKNTGALILGAGIVKHHILNANLFRNGLDHCVLVNTAQEYDGSDAGAQIDESVSWGKVKKNTKSVKVHADAAIVFPILVSAVWPTEKCKDGLVG